MDLSCGTRTIISIIDQPNSKSIPGSELPCFSFLESLFDGHTRSYKTTQDVVTLRACQHLSRLKTTSFLIDRMGMSGMSPPKIMVTSSPIELGIWHSLLSCFSKIWRCVRCMFIICLIPPFQKKERWYRFGTPPKTHTNTLRRTHTKQQLDLAPASPWLLCQANAEWGSHAAHTQRCWRGGARRLATWPCGLTGIEQEIQETTR